MAGYKDELEKELKTGAFSSVVHGFGPGTTDRGWFRYNPITKQVERFEPKKREASNAPIVIQDTMDPIEYMGNANREMFDSKSAYRRKLKEDGYVETGGAHLTGKPAPKYKSDIEAIKDDVARAMNDIKYNNVPFSEQDREAFRRENLTYETWLKRVNKD